MAGNRNLLNAKAAKNDEFYTRLSDIEDELRHYKEHFEGKTVLCNCDDPFESDFFRYFVLSFNWLGLKKLIATSYAGSPIAGGQFRYTVGADGRVTFSFNESGDADDRERHPYKAVVTTVHDATGDGGVGMEDVAELFRSGENSLTPLDGDGDFRSDECLELLDEADIVVTNPPFSLFREYVALLMEHGKKFLIIGNKNAVAYKEFFPLLKDNRVWIGYNSPSEFDTPGGATKKMSGLTRWFTNLKIKKQDEDLFLVDTYSPEKYPRYDNYDAIEVSKVSNIPKDYAGVMGVPITFMDKYNPDQFEIIGATANADIMDKPVQLGEDFINDYRGQGGTGHFSANMYCVCYHDRNGRAKIPYDRILIRNRHPEQPEVNDLSIYMNKPIAAE